MIYSSAVALLSVSAKLSYGESFSSACVAVLLIATLSLILKTFGFKGAPIFIAISFCVVLSSAYDKLSGLVPLFSDFSSVVEISVYTKACLKVIGVGYLSGISADICREIGEAGAAKCVNLLAKLEIVGICVPFMKEMFLSALELIGG